MLIGPMRSLGVTLGLAQRATASGARIFQVLDRDPRIVERPDAQPLPAGNGHVQLRGVTLRYDESDDFGATYVHAGGHEARDRNSEGTGNGNGAIRTRAAALSDIDLDVPAGTTVALVGGTGSGKTSLVSLISRLYDASEGEVLLDGADVRDLQLPPAAPGGRDRQRRPVPVLGDGGGEHRLRTSRTPLARRSKRRRAAPRPTASSARCRRATRRASASAASRSPAASASASRSRARCSPTPAC